MKEDIKNQSNNLSPNNVYNDINQKFNYFSNKKKSSLRKEISNYLINKYIFTSYSKLIQVYQIIGLSFDKNPNNTVLTFSNGKEKKSILIKSFFKEEYDIIIKDDTQPLLFCKKIKHRVSKSGSNRRRKRNGPLINEETFLIPLELSYIINIEKLAEKINKIKNEKDLIEDIKEINNDELINNTNDENDDLYYNEDDLFNNSFFDEKTNLLEYLGKKIEIKNNENKLNIIDHGNYSLIRNNLIQTNLCKDKWIIFYPIIYRNDAHTFIKNIISYSKKIRLNIEEPYELISGEYGKETKSINDDMIETFKNFFKENSPLKYSIIVILYDDNCSFYEKLKEITINEIGIISQFISVKKSNYNQQSYYNSIIRQILMKVNTPIFKIDFNYFCQKNSNLMICGLNIINKGNKFIISLLSSFDNDYINYYFNYIEIDFNITQIGNELKSLFQKAFDYFNKYNDENIQNLVIYASSSDLSKYTKNQNSSNDLDLVFEICLNYLPKIFNGEIKFSLISPQIFHYENESNNNISNFTIIKFNNKFMIYFIYQNDLNFSIDDLYNLTFTLTFYYWTGDINMLLPNCLHNSIIVGKLLQKISMEKIPKQMKSKPFYI